MVAALSKTGNGRKKVVRKLLSDQGVEVCPDVVVHASASLVYGCDVSIGQPVMVEVGLTEGDAVALVRLVR